MRTAAMILGIIGGIIALFIGIGTWSCGMIADQYSTAVGETQYGILGFVVFALAIIGLVGGAISRPKPVTGSILMLLSGIAGFLLVTWIWIFPAVLFIIGAVLAFIGRHEDRYLV